MRAVLMISIVMLLMASCEQYEPLVVASETVKEDKGGQDMPQGEFISAFASGAEYVLYFSAHGVDYKPLYIGAGRYTDRINIPDITPLDLWLETIPVTQDSVFLQLGCTRVATVNRIRLVTRR
jgi:hypothetical protein